MRIDYKQILQQPDEYEAAYQWLEQEYGHHVPYMHPDLAPHLVRCVQAGTSEQQFRRDAHLMFNV